MTSGTPGRLSILDMSRLASIAGKLLPARRAVVLFCLGVLLTLPAFAIKKEETAPAAATTEQAKDHGTAQVSASGVSGADDTKHDVEKKAEHAEGHAPGAPGHEAHAEAHGLPNAAPTFGKREEGAWINSSMIVTWIVALLVIWSAQRATRSIRGNSEAANLIPHGSQNFWELLVEGMYNFLGEILGNKLVKKTFWFFVTIFIFILATNWFGLIPGVGTIGWGHYTEQGFHVATPLFRGGNADLNMTAAMALTFFFWWIIWAVRENSHGKKGAAGVVAGVIGVVKHIFAPKGKEDNVAMRWFLVVVFFAVGVIEVVSILFRPVSLSFRLYGNVFAGENILESMQMVVPALAPFLPIPFYFLELLVGLVQALVFTLLTSVFTLLICEHEEGHEESHDESHEGGHAAGHGGEAKAH